MLAERSLGLRHTCNDIWHMTHHSCPSALHQFSTGIPPNQPTNYHKLRLGFLESCIKGRLFTYHIHQFILGWSEPFSTFTYSSYPDEPCFHLATLRFGTLLIYVQLIHRKITPSRLPAHVAICVLGQRLCRETKGKTMGQPAIGRGKARRDIQQ